MAKPTFAGRQRSQGGFVPYSVITFQGLEILVVESSRSNICSILG